MSDSGTKPRRSPLTRRPPDPAVGFLEMRREPYVAVVEAHDEVAAPGKVLAEAVGPAEHLNAKPHDEQHGRVGRTAEGLVRDLDAMQCRRALDHRRSAYATNLFGRSGGMGVRTALNEIALRLVRSDAEPPACVVAASTRDWMRSWCPSASSWTIMPPKEGP
jgi:hypothetical protein